MLKLLSLNYNKENSEYSIKKESKNKNISTII